MALMPLDQAGSSLPKSRVEAVLVGARHYQTDSPCLAGHYSPRYTNGGYCIQCMLIRRGTTERRCSARNIERSAAAMEEGGTTYIPDLPCKNGHNLRFASTHNCVQCDKDTRVKHAAKRRINRVRKEYGLSNEDYLDMVANQKSKCKICHKYEVDYKKLHIDHCHDSNVVRGLLCGKCNQGIGLLNHDTALLKSAIDYLEVA